MKCIGCGKEIPNDSLFCTYCGTDLSGAQQVQTQQTVQQEYQQQASQQVQPQQTVQQQYQQSATQQQQPQQFVQPQQQQYQQPVPQQPSPQGGGSKKGLLIAGICIGVALLIVGVVIVILLLKKDDDDGDDKKAEKTTEITTEATTEEITTEAVTEATPDEPAPTPYAEEHGISFSGLGEKASGNSNAYFYYQEDFESGNGVGFYENEFISPESVTYSTYVNDVVVSDPDSEGNVIYTVEVIGEEETAVVDKDNGNSWVVSSQSWRPRTFDYYSGSFIDNGNTDSGIGDKTEFENTNLVFDDKETNVKSIYSYEWLNKDKTEENVDNGKKTSFVDDVKYVYCFKVPQDYDGLVIALYNGDIDRDEYDKASDLDDKPRYKDDNGNPIKFFDEDAIGYTKNADNNIFIRLSDVARKATPDAISSIYSVIDYPDISDFSWTDDVKGGDYSQGNETITDSAAVNGWWQGYILWNPDNKMDSYGEELCNVQLTGSGSSMDWKWDYYEMRWGDSEEWETKDEETTMTGTFNSDGTLTFDAASIGMAFEIYGFYTDGYHQYAVGWMTVQSGEQAWVFLYRP